MGKGALWLKPYSCNKAVSGRNIDLEGVEDMVGIFINTIPLRISINPREALQDFLRRIQNKMSSHQERVYISLAEIQATQRERQLFDTLFVFENYPMSNKKGNSFNRFSLKKHRNLGTTEYTLTLNVVPSNETKLHLNYNKKHLQKYQITHFKQIIQQLCELLVKEKNNLIGNISTITQKELTKLQTWNETKHEYPKDKTIHELFEESVQANPDRIAITYEDQQISYRVLNQRVNQLAHYLVKEGVSIETPIAISLPRSPELIIGLLAILKSGGTYVPIDPEYPTERIHYMLGDSKASILLTTQEIRDSFDLNKIQLNKEHESNVVSISRNLHLKKINIICLDEESLNKSLQSEKDTNPNIQIPADSLCYIIYTSGSTGRPKGVGVCYSSMISRISYLIKKHQINRDWVIANKIASGFDPSLREMFLSIITGAKLSIVSSTRNKDAEALVKYCIKEKPNLLLFTPSHLDVFVNTLSTNQPHLRCLRIIYACGEYLESSLLTRSIKRLPNTIFKNQYGPTESCQFSFEYSSSENKQQPKIVPAGKIVDNMYGYILDANLNQVPIGTTGEIYIGGVGLARGYVGKPGLTSEKFIANPYGDKEEIGSRLYRTGDLGRYLPDGNIEFIGRIDHQVKIRGFRIELGEIESVLFQHNQIKQAVVLAREDIPGQKRLVGYVVLKEVSTKDLTEESKQELIESLRELTAKSLPDYMQLSQIVILDEFPLTQNGKLDRKALPAPEGREGVGLYQAPEGLLEQKLAVIWQELLKIEKVGRNDNFFNLGGHSLIATQLIAKIRNEQKIEIPLHAIFEHSTLQAFAKSLTDEYLSQDTLPPIERASRDQLIPLSFAQQRLWFIDQLVTGKGLYHIPRAVRLGGELDASALRKALNHMVRRHEILRTLIISKEGLGTQLILNEDTPFNLTELDLDTKEELDAYLAQESTSPFDFEKTPLCRGSLIKSNGEYILLIIFHHIISDGWSAGIWNRELSSLYLSYKQGIEPNLLPLPIQYADFSIWQRSWLSGDVLEKQLHYWQEQLADISTLELPTDYPRPKQQSYKGSSYSFQLDKEVLGSLNTISKDNGATLFMTILSAFQGTLSKYSNQTDIVIGTPIAGRRMQETEGLIGFFVNTLVLRANTEHNPTFKELLLQVKETTLGAYILD